VEDIQINITALDRTARELTADVRFVDGHSVAWIITRPAPLDSVNILGHMRQTRMDKTRRRLTIPINKDYEVGIIKTKTLPKK
jgi:hypothetical protein